MAIALPAPQLLELEGPDASAFAHAQFSSDVAALPFGQWHWSAWLSASGRVRALFRLLRMDDSRLVVWSHATSAAMLRAALAPFVLRMKVAIRPIEDRRARGYFDRNEVAAEFGSVPTGRAFVARDGGVALCAGPGRWLAFESGAAAAPEDAGTERWRAADIAEGIVELSDAQSGRFLPSWLGLDVLGAVSTSKGCYPGQEIVARLHFRGGNKRWLHRVAIAGERFPEPGAELHADTGAESGEFLMGAPDGAGNAIGLAVLPETAPGALLHARATPQARIRVVCAIRSPSA